jgi:nicotinamidase-related amidase
MTDPWTRPKFDPEPGKTVLLVIDMQYDFLAGGAPYESSHGREMIGELNGLIQLCRTKAIPVVFTIHSHRADGTDLGAVRYLHPLTAAGKAMREGTQGVELYPDVDVRDTDHFVAKRRFSAFFETELDLLLRNLGAEVLIVAGVATNVCCESTVRDAFFRDYKVIFLSDGNGTIPLADAGWGAYTPEEVQRFTLTAISTFFGEVASMAEVTERLTS